MVYELESGTIEANNHSAALLSGSVEVIPPDGFQFGEWSALVTCDIGAFYNLASVPMGKARATVKTKKGQEISGQVIIRSIAPATLPTRATPICVLELIGSGCPTL